MRNPEYVLKSLSEKAKNKEYRYERLYRNLYNPEFYLLAYQNMLSRTLTREKLRERKSDNTL